MRWICAVLLAFVSISTVNGQEYDEYGRQLHVKCHTTEAQEALFEDQPDMRAEDAYYRSVLKSAGESRKMRGQSRDGDPYIIPVVFHIIHNFGDENISTEQIEDCIRVLNEDFSASNSGASQVNPAFADIVADVGIVFRLATIDPEGNCTNGIVRKASPLTNQGGNNLKQVSPIWDRSKYLNIWVCRSIASGAAAYTYYPSSLAGGFGLVNDGIVSRADYVGAIGTSSPMRSHTMSHEVGHWIDLPHLWGSTNQPNLESNCDLDDGIEDTPNTTGWVTCNVNGESCGSLDNVENYMEYSFCSKMFTLGQKERMLTALESDVASRFNLWQMDNLIETGVLMEEDVFCDAKYSVDKHLICAGESVQYFDESFSNITSRTWIFEGGSPGVSNEENPVVTYSQPGWYSTGLLVSDGNSQLTEVKTKLLKVIGEAENHLPYSEDFEGYFSFEGMNDQVWFKQNRDGEVPWQITTQASLSGSKSAMVSNYGMPSGTISVIESETFAAADTEGPLSLSFKYAHANRTDGDEDMLLIWGKRSCETNWSVRRTITAHQLPTVTDLHSDAFVPSGPQDWREVVIGNMTTTFQTDEFRLKFEFISGSGNNIYLDDINLIDGITLSTDDLFSGGAAGVSAWPNPSSAEMRLRWETESASGETNIDLYDVSGRLVGQLYHGRLGSGIHEQTVQLNQFSPGVYIVTIQSALLPARTLRVVKSAH